MKIRKMIIKINKKRKIINKLNSVKKKIKKINDFLFRENEKNNNLDNSFDSQVDLDFKHIKPKIMKDNSIEEYFKEEQNNRCVNDNISKPVLIKAFPRPKLNMPKFPSFFINHRNKNK